MIANRRFSRDDEGISTVVGAVLVVGLLFSAIITVRLNFVPVWEHEAEAAHHRQVLYDLGLVRFEMERHTGNRTTTATTVPVDLHYPRTSVLSAPANLDVLRFRPGTQGSEAFRLTSPSLLLISLNGTNFAGVNDTWIGIAGSPGLTNVATIDALRLRIAEVDRSRVGGWVTLSVTDANGAFAGSFTFSVGQDQPDQLLVTTSRNAAGEIVAQTQQGFHQQDHFAPYWVNTLDQATGFAQVLAAVASPFSIAVSQSGLSADYTAAFGQLTASGVIVPQGSSGQIRAPYALGFGAGVLEFESKPSEFPSQKFTLEHGAVILDQGGAAVMKQPPATRADIAGTTFALDWTLPTMTGDGSSATGGVSASVILQSMSQTSVVGIGARYNFTLETRYPTVWAQYWTDLFTSAGLTGSGSTPGFIVTPGAQSVAVQIYGPTSDPNSTVQDLSISLDHAVIDVSVES